MNAKLIYLYFIAILATCPLASCSHDTPDNECLSTGAEMVFDVVDGSRASAISSFNEFILYGDMKFMDHEPTVVFDKTNVEYKGGKWSYANAQYWFPKHEHSFIAMNPVDATGISGMGYSGSQLSFTYTIPENFESAHDLMMATHRRKMPEDNPSYSADPVRLKFFHILSRIDFKVKNDKAADYVKVTQIKLIGVNKTSSFSIIPAPLSSGSGQTDDYISSWTGISNKGTLTANIDVNITEDETGFLFPDDNALFMIPQPDNNDVVMEITYEQWDDGAKFEEHTLTATAPIGGWESGKVYTYSLAVSETSQETYLTVSVKNWQGLNNSSGITVPEN